MHPLIAVILAAGCSVTAVLVTLGALRSWRTDIETALDAEWTDITEERKALAAERGELNDAIADHERRRHEALTPRLHERVAQAQAQPARPAYQPETWTPRDDRKPASHDMVSAPGTDAQRRPESPTAPLAFDQLREMLAASANGAGR